MGRGIIFKATRKIRAAARVSFGHEIEHTKNENSTLKRQKGERASEAAAQSVGAKIIRQLKQKKKN